MNVFDEMMNSVSAAVEVARRLDEVGAVDVGDEAERQVAPRVVAQRLVRHHRPEVGAADADVDDVADRLAGVALPLARADAVGEGGHPVEHRVHLGHDVLAVDDDRRRLAASRSATCSTARSSVTLICSPRNIAVDALAQAGLLGQLHQQRERLVGDPVLRVVEVQAGAFRGQPLAPVRVRGEQVPDVRRRDLLVVRLESLPGGARAQRHDG